ncbi:NADH-quinone oxidoreductase subunit NuoG [Tistrella mobilis]|uniref:NADH-quinone oxidoreductase subunit NuoG n=1 Tax=Tistrella mobilis TaxID=171437 RepID=UPI0031F6B4E9
MPKLTIDGLEVEVPAGATVLQACEAAGAEIPRFCYHERLSIAGNCRMCLVEQERAPKPIASCAMPAADGMVIHTNTERVKKAREGVMEFLLINHPLDCPICDQGGECDLQDQAMAYGRGQSRYDDEKRAVKDKDLGPLIQTWMTRCIHCTRCVRFATEIAGVPEMGATGRGEHMEIGTYVEKALSSELSGNMIDLCPVGALTSKPYAFNARPWELKKTESIDVLDAVGANIRVDVRGREVLRILPRLHEDVNEEWLGDKSRFAYDGLKRQRLDRPYIRENGRLRPAGWDEAFEAIRARLAGRDPKKVAGLVGDLVDCESMTAFRDLMRDVIGTVHVDCRQDGAALDPTQRSTWLFNSTIAGIEQADAVLLVGTDPRREAPLVNARFRKRWRKGGFRGWSIGPKLELTWPIEDLGADATRLEAIASGADPLAEVLRNAERPMIVVGMGALTRADGARILGAARKVAERCGMVRDGWNGFNVLQTAAARVGGMELGLVPGEGGLSTREIVAAAGRGEIDTVFLLGADEIQTDALGDAFVIYQGHHGDAGAHRADVVLPGAAYTEKNATYVNLEGRPQRAHLAVFPVGEAREDWKILRALSGVLGKALPYDDLSGVRARMAAIAPRLAKIDRIEPAGLGGAFGQTGAPDKAPLSSPVTNYYMTDPISRASKTMATCTAIYAGNPLQQDKATGTNG